MYAVMASSVCPQVCVEDDVPVHMIVLVCMSKIICALIYTWTQVYRLICVCCVCCCAMCVYIGMCVDMCELDVCCVCAVCVPVLCVYT